LTALAGIVDLSLYHFARAFKQSFGAPPHRYHMTRRIDRARSLLQRPTLSVTQIGIQLGFRETSSFTKAFRKFTGLTPTDYRRQQEISLTISELSPVTRVGSQTDLGECSPPAPI
jgi:AraC family transcriptional regulator